MIGRLTGTVVGDEPDGSLTLDVGGVGYEVLAPLGTVGKARAMASAPHTDPIVLHIHTHVREDTFTLFGFATPDDKSAFRLLISVSNIGPKTALAVLSALSVAELANALASKDVQKLVGVPGIGRKTAERLVLELKDKLVASAVVAVAPAGAPPQSGQLSREDTVSRALTGMGYRPAEADRAIQQLRGKLDTLTVPELIREALAVLAR